MATFAANTLCLCNTDNKPKIKSTRKIYYDYKLNGNGFNTAKNLKNFYNYLINLEIGKPIDSIVQKGIIDILEGQNNKKAKEIKKAIMNITTDQLFYENNLERVNNNKNITIGNITRAIVLIDADKANFYNKENIYML